MSSLSIFKSYAVELEKFVTQALSSTIANVIISLIAEYVHNPLYNLENQKRNNLFRDIYHSYDCARIDVSAYEAFCSMPSFFTGIGGCGLANTFSNVKTENLVDLGIFDEQKHEIKKQTKQTERACTVTGPTGTTGPLGLPGPRGSAGFTGPVGRLGSTGLMDCYFETSSSVYDGNHVYGSSTFTPYPQIEHVTEWLERSQQKKLAAKELSMIAAHCIVLTSADLNTYNDIQHLIEEHHDRIGHSIRQRCPLVFCQVSESSLNTLAIIYDPKILKEDAAKTKLVRFLWSLLPLATKWKDSNPHTDEFHCIRSVQEWWRHH